MQRVRKDRRSLRQENEQTQLTVKKSSIMQPQNYIECILAHCPAERFPHLSEEVIKKWDDHFLMTALLDIANEAYLVGHMTNDDGRCYGSRYSKDLPDACRIALKWAESSKDQSSRLWSQWTIER